MLTQVAATRTSTFGITYDARPRKSVRYGSAMRQNGFLTERANGPPPRALTFAVTEVFASNPVSLEPSSGSWSRTAQPAASQLPELGSNDTGLLTNSSVTANVNALGG